jgi:hypothetical protein
MKIKEFKLIYLIVRENNKVIYEGMAESAPEDVISRDISKIRLENGKAIIDC